MQENKLFSTNTFSKRVNRFKNATFIEEKYKTFDFNNNLKSNNIQDLQFTNYVKSNYCSKYLELKEICVKIHKNEKEWDKLFVADEIDISINIPKLDRIYKIINAVNNKDINREELILKFKYLNDKEIQFYVKNDNGVLKLYLIDLYHIGIEATNVKTGRADRKGIYKARKEYKYDIKEIEKQLNKTTDKP